ncbi:hypothetical protein BVX98_06730 [bacterium F11]|nr:hypothetical protein BVX98_06730 [bacterium F11]
MPNELFAPIVIENVVPQIDGGAFAAKWFIGDPLTIQADIYKDGHDFLAASLKYKEKSQPNWNEVPMNFLVNDHWEAVFTPDRNTRYDYQIEAWFDPIKTWLSNIEKKAKYFPQVDSEVAEGVLLLGKLEKLLPLEDQKQLSYWVKRLKMSEGMSDEVLRIIKTPEFESVVFSKPLKTFSANSPLFHLTVDRKLAQFGTWYELFPRSQGTSPGKSGTFRDCIRRLPDIKRMGFNVLYLPPIHPIGKTNRKGPNNSLKADENAPGSPWAIGNKEGGHKAIHPDLGTLEDFREFVQAAADYNIEVALDFALQCSPDHPYVKEHPEWFYRLPDGSIRYAENPPKKYEDIYPLDFMCQDKESLWNEMKSIVDHWIEQGVKIFRVDNPHTKTYRFWQWLIREVQKDHPEVIFLAEAFTRPRIMEFLAKCGYTQSYTYFTWRNTNWELRQYLEELTQTDKRYYFRPNFFANTPDILPFILQTGGKPAFKMRVVLAGTLSPTYGIYSGYEFCENAPLKEGKEEYLNSEKFEIKVRDWNKEGNIKDYISQLNYIRNENAALQQLLNIEFYDTKNDNLLAYGKWNHDKSNIIVTVVNLDPHNVQEGHLHLPLWKFDINDWQTYQMRDLLTGDKFNWKGQYNFVRLNPHTGPAHIFKLLK